MLIYTSEQHQAKPLLNLSDYHKSILSNEVYQKAFYYNKEMLCFRLCKKDEDYFVDSNYFIGVDWLVAKSLAIYIEPKLNDRAQINFMRMLLESFNEIESLNHLEGLFHVDYDAPWIPIPQQKDILSPLLILQFLKLIQKIVRKGLKKSYYSVSENLDSRIKGKILIGKQIKENIVKNKITKTICTYQQYGVNTEENKFLKLVLEFVSSYLHQEKAFFTEQQNHHLHNILRYCQPAFENVDVLKFQHQKISIQKNVFYNEYAEAIKIGYYILKRFSFNINKVSERQTLTPPFWIDMSKLFELYVFGKLKTAFNHSTDVSYHDTFIGGKETDILIRTDGYKCVIDCKYKPQYRDSTPSLDDKRQLAGYTRLKSVYHKLGIDEKELIKGIIIYPDQNTLEAIEKENLFKTSIEEYVDFYKIGVRLPELAIN